MKTCFHVVNRCADAARAPGKGSSLPGGWQVVDVVVDATALIAGIIGTTRNLSGTTSTNIELVAPGQPVFITTDPVILRRIITNLVNICSATSSRVTIAIKVIGSIPEIVVANAGDGLRHQHPAERVSEMDRTGNAKPRVDEAIVPVLSVSRDLARLIGGSISARSVSGRETMFILTLPLRTTERGRDLYTVE